ncbi:MAG: DUF4397 domain-containing protein [Bacteroidota bacterium]
MKNLLTLLVCLALSFVSFAQDEARLQIIHNSPDPTVDIYVNGTLFEGDFQFREATEFRTVPANVDLVIGVAAGPGSTPSDIIETFTINLMPDDTLVAFATGILNDMMTPFDIQLEPGFREAAQSSNVEFRGIHGSPNAPTVDIIARDVATLLDDVSYRDISDYIPVPAGVYTLDVTDPTDNEQIVASFEADLSSLGGGSAVVFASGLLGGTPGFGLFAALADGTVVEFPAVANEARLQVIHNSPDPTVDIYVNGTLYEGDFSFREATEFRTVPAGVTLNVGIAAGPGSSPSDIIDTFPLVLAPDETYIAVASGILNDMTTPLTVIPVADVRETANGTDVEFIGHHGSPTAPTVDIIARGVATLLDDVSYPDVSDYIPVPAGVYTLDVTDPTENEQIVASFEADLSSLGGGTAFVFASGLFGGTPGFGLFAALADGTVVEFPAVTNEARLQVIHNSPDPTVDIYVNGNLYEGDFSFREATEFRTVPAGVTLNVGIAAGPGSSPSDIIDTFPLVLAPDETYIAVASGILNNMTTPLTVIPVADVRETANGTDVEFIGHHGSPTAPTVDIIARGVATLLDDVSYPAVSDYIPVPAAVYTLDVTDPTDNEQIVASFEADLSSLGGGTAFVFASGLFGGTPGFGLFAALADGTVVEFPAVTNEARLQVIHNSPDPNAAVVDVYVNGALYEGDFAFREATEFRTVPAGVTLNVGLAPGPGSTPSDIIDTFPLTLAPNDTTIAIATGLLGNMMTPLTVFEEGGIREAAQSGNVEFKIHHGSPNAPEVDAIARTVATLADDVVYSNTTDYIAVPEDLYYVDITPADNSSIVATFEVDLNGLGGGAAFVFASGLLNGTPGFGLYAALADGTIVEFPATTVARAQIIHNSPSPTVDIYLNGDLFRSDFEFQTATEFFWVPGGQQTIDVAPSPSTSVGESIYDITIDFVNGETYVAMATGQAGNMDDPFIILANAGQERANDPAEVDLLLYHGAPDAPEVDVTVNGSNPLTILFDDVEYQEYQGYLNVPPADYNLDVQLSDNSATVQTYLAPLAGAAGAAGVVFASGFLNDTPGFSVLVAFPDGTVLPLSIVTSTVEVNGVVDALDLFPSPADQFATINYGISESTDLQYALFAANGQMVKTGSFGTQSSGQYTEQISLSDLPEGFYVFQLISENGSAFHKLTIQR